MLPVSTGNQSQFRRKRESDFTRQLRAKQKARRIYGLYERQFHRYYQVSLKRRGLTGLNLLQILESRLDNVGLSPGVCLQPRRSQVACNPRAFPCQRPPHGYPLHAFISWR
jgi:ribosomal protein S4